MKKNFRNFYLSADKFPKDKILSAPIIKTMNCHESHPAMILCHCDHVRNQFYHFLFLRHELTTKNRLNAFTLSGLCVMTLKYKFKYDRKKNQTIVTMNFITFYRM